MQNGAITDTQTPSNKDNTLEKKTTETQKSNVTIADGNTSETGANLQQQKTKDLKDIPEKSAELELDFLLKEREQLEKQINFLTTLNNTNGANLEEEKKVLAQLESELSHQLTVKQNAENALAETQKSYTTSEQSIAQQRDAIMQLATRRNEAVGKIAHKEISGLKIKDKTVANDIFRFAYHAAYGQPAVNYNWSAFKKQAFGKDNGADFYGKLKGVNFQALTNVDAGVLNTALASQTTALGELEKKNKQNASLRALYDYAATVNQAIEVNKNIATAEAQLNIAKPEVDAKNVAAQQALANYAAAENKVHLLRKYIQTLEQINLLAQKTKETTQDKIQYQQQQSQPQVETVVADDLAKSKALEGKKSIQSSPEKEVTASPIKEKQQEVVVVQEQNKQQIQAQPITENIENAALIQQQQGSGKKEVKQVPATDFTDSPAAEKKQEGACEGCNIF